MPSDNDGEAGAGGESTQAGPPERCERADHTGTFTAHYELIEQLYGGCGEPADEAVVAVDPDAVFPCERLAEDVWSDDNCTHRQHVRCGSTELLTELTLRPDGSLVGEQTRTIDDAFPCSSRYRLTWTPR